MRIKVGISLICALTIVSGSGLNPTSASSGKSDGDGRGVVRPFGPAEPADEGGETDDIGTFVIGGSTIDIMSAPWQVFLLDYDPQWWQVEIGADYFQFCGGSIVAPRWIVTAAHCIDGSYEMAYLPYLFVAAGQSNKAGLEYDDFVKVERVIKNRTYNRRTFTNDIALLYLSEPLDLSLPSQESIALPRSVGPSWPESGTVAFLTGWGAAFDDGYYSPDDLQAAEVKILAGVRAPCGSWGRYFKASTMVCVGAEPPAPVVGACFGDSGGPLVINVASVWTLAGVASWGSESCRNSAYPSVYARVTSYVSWIVRQGVFAPEKPEILDILQGDRSLLVNFSPPEANGYPITAYEYSLDGGRWRSVRCSGECASFAISRLRNGGQLSVSIRAVNASGRSPASDPVLATPGL